MLSSYRVAPGFIQVVSPLLGWSPLSSFLVIWSPSGDTWGPSVVFEAVDVPCPRPLHCFLTLLIISMTVYSPWPRCWSFCPCMWCWVYILLSISVCAAASLFRTCLVNVQVSAPYVIAGSTQGLYTCLFRQMARLLLKMSRCLAYVAQPAMILCCISLSSSFFLQTVVLSQVYVALNIFFWRFRNVLYFQKYR